MLRTGQKFGKYKISGRLAQGGFGDVYSARDTIEGISVALKVPVRRVDEESLAVFRREVRLANRLEHPNVLPIKNADVINGTFAIAYPLGDETLEERLGRRMAVRTVLDVAEQMLAALAHAHEHNIIHCDVKPDNMILFAGDRLRLTDFGIAKVAPRTVEASASGSLGYMAPEQAFGRPSARSDVFSAGLVIYRMLTGELPQWPFDWPPPGCERLRRVAPELVPFLRRALEVDTRKRYRDAGRMLVAFRGVKRKVLLRRAVRRRNGTHPGDTERERDWRAIRLRQFKQRFGKALRLDHACEHCHQPVDERMHACPWCGTAPAPTVGESSFPASCPRCARGVKLDWHYCPWCYGGKIGPRSTRRFTDRRYVRRCTNRACARKQLMPFMRYCPWCRTKVRLTWPLGDSRDDCPSCGQRVARGFWSHCAWCGTSLSET